MPHRLLYISTAEALAGEDVQSILDTSVENNQLHDITGMLLYNGHNFLQLLEGEPDLLDNLLARIRRDPRHNGVSMLHRAETEERLCDGWSMRQIVLAKRAENRRRQIERQLPAAMAGQWRETVLNFAVLN